MFLRLKDYKHIIHEQELEAITQSNPTFRQKAEKMAMAKISKYLYRQYDVDAIFGKTGEERDLTIVEYTIYFALYILYSSIAKSQVPDDRFQQYKEAKDFFEAIKCNEIDTDLPRKMLDGAEVAPTILMSSEDQLSHHY